MKKVLVILIILSLLLVNCVAAQVEDEVDDESGESARVGGLNPRENKSSIPPQEPEQVEIVGEEEIEESLDVPPTEEIPEDEAVEETIGVEKKGFFSRLLAWIKGLFN